MNAVAAKASRKSGATKKKSIETALRSAEDPRSDAEIGKRLRDTRLALKLSQREFCGEAGIAPSAYNNWEQGNARPSLDNAFRLCDAHRLSLDWIFNGDPTTLRPLLVQAISALRNVSER